MTPEISTIQPNLFYKLFKFINPIETQATTIHSTPKRTLNNYSTLIRDGFANSSDRQCEREPFANSSRARHSF